MMRFVGKNTYGRHPDESRDPPYSAVHCRRIILNSHFVVPMDPDFRRDDDSSNTRVQDNDLSKMQGQTL